jgi:YVTN family beta-propeller protein
MRMHAARSALGRNQTTVTVRRRRDRSLALFLVIASSLSVVMAGCDGGEPHTSSGSAHNPATVPGTVAVPLGVGEVYTANERGGSISRIDLTTGRVTTFAVGFLPHNVQVSVDGRHILAVGSPPGAISGMEGATAPPTSERSLRGRQTEAPQGQFLSVAAAAIDTVGAVRIAIGREPAHVISDAAGSRAYATTGEANAVIVIDLARGRITDTIATAAGPHGLRARPDGRELYVAGTKDNAVSVIDVASQREVARVRVGRAPVQVAFLPDGERAYVTLRDDNAVAVIDTRTRRVLATIPVGRGPIQLIAAPDGRLVYVANQGTETEPDSTVSVIDTRRNAVARTLTVGRGAHGVAISDDGRRVFVANTFAGTVSVINTMAQHVIATVRVGTGPGGITYRAPMP